MKKFEIIENGCKYVVIECTAIADCDDDFAGARQDALYVFSLPVTEETNMAGETYITGVDYGGEMTENVVFGWNMPENAEDFADMFNDCSAWESCDDALSTVKIDEIRLCELQDQLGGTLGLL